MSFYHTHFAYVCLSSEASEENKSLKLKHFLVERFFMRCHFFRYIFDQIDFVLKVRSHLVIWIFKYLFVLPMHCALAKFVLRIFLRTQVKLEYTDHSLLNVVNCNPV